MNTAGIMYGWIKRATTVVTAIGLLAGVLFLAGCAEKKPGVDDKTDIKIVKSALKKGYKTKDPERRIKYLRTAYVMAGKLETAWPDSDRVPVFLQSYEGDISTIPDQVFELSKEGRDIASFKWAVAHGAKVDLDYDALLDIWQMGRDWREFYLSEYPERSLSIFMSEAVNGNNQRFFNQHIDAFGTSGYKLAFPLQESEFHPRFRLFVATMIDAAVKKNDQERVESLLDHIPPHQAGEHVDAEAAAIMRSLSNYAFHEIKDEAMACRLVEYNYPTVRIDIDKSGFGSDFARVLMAAPEAAVTNVFKLNQWHGPLTEKEARFVLVLKDGPLRLVHRQYLTEAVTAAMKKKDTKKAMQLIKLREELAPMKIYEYDRLLSMSIELRNREVYEYVKNKCTQFDIYTIDLVDLAKSENLFKMHASKVFRRIYPTMDMSPRPDGTTIGRINRMFEHRCPEAALYVVSKYKLDDAWLKAGAEHTVLMAVCRGGNLEAAKYLIEKKRAKVNAETYYSEQNVTLFGSAQAREGKLTALFFAAAGGNSELITYLVSRRRAEVNARSNFGATPLMYAVANGQTDAVKTLIKLGASVNASVTASTSIKTRDHGEHWLNSGDTAYRLALRTGQTDIRDILKEAGAR